MSMIYACLCVWSGCLTDSPNFATKIDFISKSEVVSNRENTGYLFFVHVGETHTDNTVLSFIMSVGLMIIPY